MNIILRIMGKLFRWDRETDEAWERFIQPRLEYGLSIGIPANTLSDMAHRAINESDGVATFPGLLLRDYIAEWEANRRL